MQTWRHVSERTLKAILDLDEELLLRNSEAMPRFVSRDWASLRTYRPISSDYFVETHLSASATYQLCAQAAQLAELGPEDWFVTTTPRI